MEYPMLILLHVGFGLFWAGAAIMTGFFVVPAVLEAGPPGGGVMTGIMKRKFAQVMVASGVIVVLTGLRLYSVRFSSEWLASPEGIVLGLGGIFGIGALAIGVFVQKPTAERLGALGAEIQASGAPPNEAQAAEMAALRVKLGKVARLLAFHMVGAVLMMAGHRLAAAL